MMDDERSWCPGGTTGNRQGEVVPNCPRIRILASGDWSWPGRSISVVVPPIDFGFRSRVGRCWKSVNRTSGGVLRHKGRRSLSVRDGGWRPGVGRGNTRGDLSSTSSACLPWEILPVERLYGGHFERSAFAVRLTWVFRHPTIVETKLVGPERGFDFASQGRADLKANHQNM